MVSDYYENILSSQKYLASRAAKAELIARICGSFIERAERVADLGCGTGLIRAELSRIFDRTVVGIDISQAFLRNRDDVVVGDLLALPFPDHTFDFAICNHVYEHVADLELFFRELRRVTVCGGKVYMTAGSRYAIMEPHYRLPLLSWLPKGLAGRYLRLVRRGSSYRGIRFRSHRSLVRLAGKAGFAVKDITGTVILDNSSRIVSTLGRTAAVPLRLLPGFLAKPLLSVASPQWFFLLTAVETAYLEVK